MPTNYKLCSFNCVYCHYGWTEVLTKEVNPFIKDLPGFDDVVRELKRALVSSQEFDYITFSGNGEPTLYPEFANVVSELVELRDRYRPGVRIALLSNSSGLDDETVRDSVTLIDLPVFKLDAGTEGTFKAVNRPARGIKYSEIIAHLGSLGGISVQTVLIAGTPHNTSESELEGYMDKITMINPDKVHIYSIDRPVPDVKLTRVLPERLVEIAHHGRARTGVDFQAFYLN